MKHGFDARRWRSELRSLGLASCATMIFAWPPFSALCAQQIVVGAVGAANAAPTGRAPGQAIRLLSPGADIFFKDRIATKRGGSAQLTFLDRSTLTIGENSDLTIDEFVYKPGAQNGTMKTTLTKGLLRFVGGDVSHSGGTEIKTPTVVIGIRGGIGTVGYIKDAGAIQGMPEGFHGGTVVVNGYGTLTVRNGASEQVISRPGFAVFVGSAREVIAAPIRFNDVAAREMATIVSRGSGSHGAAPSNNAASVAGLSSGVGLRLTEPATQSSPGIDALDYTAIFSAGNALARAKSQEGQALQVQQAVAMQAAARAAAAVAASSNGSPAGNGTGGNSSGGNTSNGNTATSGSGSTSSSGSTGTNSSGSGNTGSGSTGNGNTGSGNTGTNSAGTSSTGSATTGGSASMPASPGALSGTLNSHDINANTVTANVIYAHEIDAQHIAGVIHMVNGSGNGNGSGGDVSTTNVQSGTIDAHDIHATNVIANDIYVQSINGN